MEPYPTVEATGLRVEARIVVALVAYRSRNDFTAAVAQRYLQTMLVRSKRQSAKRLLKRLVDERWIEEAVPHTQLTPKHFCLGDRISEPERCGWEELGRRLFDPAFGSLGPFLLRPAIKWGYLGPAAMVVLGVCINEGPVRRLSLVHGLAPLVSRSCLCNPDGVLDRLQRERLLLESDDGLLLVPDDFDERLARYEEDSGANARTERVLTKIAVEQARNRERHLGGADLQHFKSWLRSQPCEVCGNEAVDERGEVEHWPPKKLGGFDARGLLRPICRPCNNVLGQRIRRMPAADMEQAAGCVTIFTAVPSEVGNMADAVLEVRFLQHVRDAEPDQRSTDRIVRALHLWNASNGWGVPGSIVDLNTGEITEVGPVDIDTERRASTRTRRRWPPCP